METTDSRSLYEIATGLEQVVAILCYGRSGSLFFQSLLDGHPDLIVTAGLCLHHYYPFFKDNSRLPAQQLVAQFIEDFAVIFDAHNGCSWGGAEYAKAWGFNCMGVSRDEFLFLDRKVFSDCLMNILNQHALNENAAKVPRKLFFQAVHVAYQIALGRSINSNTLIVFPLHAPYPRWQSVQFAEDFPNAKHIFTIREPIETLASLFRYMCKNGFDKLTEGSYHINGVFVGGEPHRLQGCGYKSDLVNSMLSASPLVNQWKACSRAIKLEDLHRDSQINLERVCQWLGIPWNDVVLTSTFHGVKWWNSANSPQISGFSEVTIAKKSNEDVLTSIDIFRLKVLAFHKYAVWNYEIPQWYSSLFAKLIVLPLLLVPFKMELISFSIALSRQKISPWTKLILIIKAFIDGRRRLFTAWLSVMSPGNPEAELLK